MDAPAVVTAAVTEPGSLGWLRSHVVGLLILLLGAGLAITAGVASWQWVGKSFPGFLLMEDRIVTTVSARGWPARNTMTAHSQVVAIDGLPVATTGEAYRLAGELAPGTEVGWTIRRTDRRSAVTSEVRLPILRFSVGDWLETYGILLFFGVASLAMAGAVAILQPNTPAARAYVVQGVVGGVYPLSAVFLHLPGHPVLHVIYFAAECFFPATFVNLALVFPVERDLAGRRRWWFWGPYLTSALLFAAVIVGMHAEPPDLRGLHLTYGYTAASILFFVAMLATGSLRSREPVVRRRILAVLPGFVAGTVAMLFSFVNNAIGDRKVPIQLGLLAPVLFYASIAWAIVKHDLFDIDRIVRQSFVYGLLSVVVLGFYAAVLVLPVPLLPGSGGADAGPPILAIFFVLAVALLLDPLRRVIQSGIDRAFYRTRLDAAATLGRLSEALASLLDLQEIAHQLTRVVGRALHLESVSLAVLDDTGHPTALWRRRAEGSLEQGEAPGAVSLLARTLVEHPRAVEPGSVLAQLPPGTARGELQQFLAEQGAALLLPLPFQGRAVGVLMLGVKLSGRSFGSDDLSLLRTVALQAAIGIQNARSVEALEALTRDLDEKVRVRTAELHSSNEQLARAYRELQSAQAQLVQSEKMASLGQLVAGVAHELNNPASFVHGGLENLAEFLTGFVEALEAYEATAADDPAHRAALNAIRTRLHLDYLTKETPELLRICREGSSRIKKIVEDLRVFARADQGDRADVQVAEGIDTTLRLLGGRIAQAGVRVSTSYDEVPALQANAGQLNQVWMNLLVNAIDSVEEARDAGARGAAAPGEVRVSIRSRAASGAKPAGVEVEVADDGLGMSEEVKQRIFEPFFTTKPVGKGTGLGLSIAFGAVRSHGGTLSVTSAPGAGCRVVVWLPLVGRVGE